MSHLTQQCPQRFDRVDDPTPEQIRERCRKIRAEWTEATSRRRAGHIERRWTVPETQDPRFTAMSNTPPA